MYAASGSHDDILELLLLQVNFTFHHQLQMIIICILDLVFPLLLEVEVEVNSSSSETYDFWCLMGGRDLSCLATRIEEILGGFIATSGDQN